MEIEAVGRSYARWALFYDQTFGAVTNVGRRRTARYINRSGARRVLEVGVGTGLALPFYAPHLSVTGIDYSAEMLAKARARVARLGLRQVVALERMDARELAFDDGSFDLAVAMHVMSVVPEPERVLCEMARVVRPGGKVLLVNHFARQRGVMSTLARAAAPMENLLGWHSDFEIERVLGCADLVELERRHLPPLSMMTFLLFERRAAPTG